MFVNFQDIAWLPVADAITKATVLLAGAALCSMLLRRRSAAARHLVWTLALSSALVLPVLSLALPRWHIPVLTLAPDAPASSVSAPAASSVAAPVNGASTIANKPQQTTTTSAATASSIAPPAVARSSRGVSWPTLLFAVWLTGAVVILLRVSLGLIAVYWLARRTDPAHDAPWMTLACRLAADVGVPSDVRFLRSSRATMPIACGIFRPSIVMPADADTWPAERLRIVLLHELAHVKRRDCLTHIVAQVACALYWFNPLVWVAARHVRTERERACDDLVLAAGTRGPDYADQLLEIARVMRAGRFPTVLAGATLAMAYRSQLEGRLMAILDPKVPRSGITRFRAAAASVLFGAALLPLASVQPWAYAEQHNENAAIESAAQTPTASAAAPQLELPRPTPTPTPSPTTESRGVAQTHEQDVHGMVQGTTQGVVQGMVQGMTQGVIQGAAQGAAHGALGSVPAKSWEVEHEVEHDVDQERQTRKGADPKTVAALTAALKDTDKEVRQTALEALVQLRDPSVYEPLIEALRDSVADVRQQAAFGLGQLRDRRAVPALIGALKDTSDDVREQAVFALGQLRDPAAVEALAGAVRDAKPDVRQQAVFALGQIRDRRAVEPLISALKDTDADVRQQAAFALGQVRERGAVEPLVIALKDSDADVRQQAAFALGQLGDPRAIDGLTSALKDPSADVRQQAAFALGQIGR